MVADLCSAKCLMNLKWNSQSSHWVSYMTGLLSGLSPNASSYRKSSQTTQGQTALWGSLSPLDSPLQPILGGHCPGTVCLSVLDWELQEGRAR